MGLCSLIEVLKILISSWSSKFRRRRAV